MNRASLERAVQRLWYGEGHWAALLLVPLAWLYGALIALRRWLYRVGVLGSHRVGVPVIVVGNITVGGTGKTPMVIWLAKLLRAQGFNPGIVSRGYGAARQAMPVKVVDRSRWQQVGDEPLLLARESGCPVYVGTDRVAAARCLLAESVDVVIADDGLQHYRLARDVEIALVDAERNLGNGRLLPAGPLREPARRLAEVDIVVVNGGQRVSEDCVMQLVGDVARPLAGGPDRPLAAFAGCRVWSVAGIGNPGRFHDLLSAMDIDAQPVSVADHGTVSLDALRIRDALPILMTEKDAVKYADAEASDVWYVPVEAEVSDATADRVLALIGAAALRAPGDG